MKQESCEDLMCKFITTHDLHLSALTKSDLHRSVFGVVTGHLSALNKA